MFRLNIVAIFQNTAINCKYAVRSLQKNIIKMVSKNVEAQFKNRTHSFYKGDHLNFI